MIAVILGVFFVFGIISAIDAVMAAEPLATMPILSGNALELLIDGDATIGTANFDNRSFRLNFEITALIGNNPEFVAEVAAMLEADLVKSRELDPDELSKRPFWFRLAVQLSRLTAPVQ